VGDAGRQGADALELLGVDELDAHPLAVLLEPQPVGQRQEERHLIGDRRGEGDLVAGPGARRADVLVADHADDAAAVADGGVEHRGDAERLEVAIGELARARIAAGIVRVDGAAALERVEVARIVAGGQDHSLRVAVGRGLVERHQAQLLPVGAEQPDARALDLDGPARLARHLAKRGSGVGDIGEAAPGQAYERRLLARHPVDLLGQLPVALVRHEPILLASREVARGRPG
jgi:hypothetical protein